MGTSTADEDLRELVTTVVDIRAPEPMGAYFFGPGDAGAEVGRHVERQVFLEAFGNTPEILAEEYDRYDPASVFVCVVDHRRRLPAGTMRLIVPTPGGPELKSLTDVEPTWGEPAGELLATAGVTLPADATWDIATLAVMPEYRGAAAAGLVSLALYQSVVGTARRAGVNWTVAILDILVYRMSRLRFCSPFVAYAPGRPYLGSASSLPVYVDIDDWQRRLASDPAIHDILFAARGIEPAVRPLDFAAAAARVPPATAPDVLDLGRAMRRPQATALPPGASAAG